MKKKVGGLKRLILILLFLLFYKNIYASQIYDYQTEQFIEKINSKILSVNKYENKIKFNIINDKFPNAFVTYNNKLHISSGLLIHSPDYVSLLAVLAHEIGHIENYHIVKRKDQIEDLENLNVVGNLVAIAGSMLIKEPELINAVTINQKMTNNIYLNFSQIQEKEADIYAVNTLNKLNLSTNSIKKFLMILERKSNSNLLDNEIKKFSTHPLFKERYEILDSNTTTRIQNFNQLTQNEFNFIKAKFMAYTNYEDTSSLGYDEKLYYQAIEYSQSGNLLQSLKILNILISKYFDNLFLLETKADILLSYGYNNEANKFYSQVLKKYPENNYAKFNIFLNTNYNLKNKDKISQIFIDNLILISIFPNHQTLLTKYMNLSVILGYSDWEFFFKVLLLNKNDKKNKLIELKDNTSDYNLIKLIKIFI